MPVSRIQVTGREIAASSKFVETRQDIGATGHADRRGHIVTVEYDAVLGQTIQIRCFNVRVAITTH